MSLASLYRFIRYMKSPGHPWPPKPTHLKRVDPYKTCMGSCQDILPDRPFFPVTHCSSQDGSSSLRASSSPVYAHFAFFLMDCFTTPYPPSRTCYTSTEFFTDVDDNFRTRNLCEEWVVDRSVHFEGCTFPCWENQSVPIAIVTSLREELRMHYPLRMLHGARLSVF